MNKPHLNVGTIGRKPNLSALIAMAGVLANIDYNICEDLGFDEAEKLAERGITIPPQKASIYFNAPQAE